MKKMNKTQTKTYVLALGNKTYVPKRVVQMFFMTQIREQNANQNARFGTWQQNVRFQTCRFLVVIRIRTTEQTYPVCPGADAPPKGWYYI